MDNMRKLEQQRREVDKWNAEHQALMEKWDWWSAVVTGEISREEYTNWLVWREWEYDYRCAAEDQWYGWML